MRLWCYAYSTGGKASDPQLCEVEVSPQAEHGLSPCNPWNAHIISNRIKIQAAVTARCFWDMKNSAPAMRTASDMYLSISCVRKKSHRPANKIRITFFIKLSLGMVLVMGYFNVP